MLMGQAGGVVRKIGVAVNTVIRALETWNEFTVPTGGGWALMIGGGGGGHGAGDGQPGASGAGVKVWLPAGKYRVWIGKRGYANSAINTDNSGYNAHGGAGGTTNDGTTGGQGGTPTILQRLVNGTWTLFAVAGAGGGGGCHLNSYSARPSGGGAWFSHQITQAAQFNLFTYNGVTICRGSLGGGWNSTNTDFNYLAGRGTANTYQGGAGANTQGLDANVQDQWAGGSGGYNSTANRSGGGGGGGFGGGCGGNEGGQTSVITAKPGGYIMVGSKRWGGTATGGGHANSCAAGGGGGGSYWPDDGKSGEIVGSCAGLTTSTDWRCQTPLPNFFGMPVTTGQGGTSGAYPSTTMGEDGGFVYTGSTQPF